MTDSTSAAEQRDYRDTVFLPKTDFPMKAGLPQKEPLILAKWIEGNLEAQIRVRANHRRLQFPFASSEVEMPIGRARLRGVSTSLDMNGIYEVTSVAAAARDRLRGYPRPRYSR